MKPLLENAHLVEIKSGNNFAYVFRNNDDFALTQYKVQHNQSSTNLLPCVRTRYNGQIELYYMTGDRKAFSTIFSTLDANAFSATVAGILAAVIGVKKIGFLSSENIDISFDKIYIDTATNQAALVYIPTKVSLFPDGTAVENELRANLVKLIGSETVFLTPKIMELANDLSDGKRTLEDVYQRMTKGNFAPLKSEFGKEPRNNSNFTNPHITPERKSESGMTLREINTNRRLEICVNRNPFVIGKNERADAILSGNEYISKRHCRVSQRAGQYYLSDLGSVNKTYINGQVLQPERDYPLNDGDIVRLANLDFKVMIQ